MKKIYRDFIILTLIIVGMLFFIFSPNILSQRPLTYGTDLKPQQFFFIKEMYRLWHAFLTTGAPPFYSWNMFLGTNFYSSMSFYGTWDIFNMIGYIFERYNFYDLQMWLVMLKILVASWAMFFYLTVFDFKGKIKIIGALCYALSSWALFFSGQLMFFSFYCLVPFYFLGMEMYIKQKKYALFATMTALLLFVNWYYFFTLSIISPIYFIYRYYLIKKNFKTFIYDVIKIIGIYILSVGVTMIVTLPTLLYMRESNRLGYYYSNLFYRDINIYLHQLASWFSPNYLYIYGNNLYETALHTTRELCLWAGSITSIATFSTLTSLDHPKFKNYRRATFLLYMTLFIILIFPSTNALMHGYSEPSFRWVFMIIFFNILTTSFFLSNFEYVNKKKFMFTSIFITLFTIIILPLSALVLKQDLSLFYSQWSFFLQSGFFMIMLLLIFWKMKNRYLTGILVLTILELSFFSYSLYEMKLNRDYSGTYEFHNRAVSVLTDGQSLNEYINYIDSNNYNLYYRIYVSQSITWDYTHNASMNYDYHGLMVYSSTIAPSLNKLIEIAPHARDYDSPLLFNIKDPNLVNLLNVKYAFVLSEDELLEGIDWKLIQDNYNGSIYIYENTSYRPLITKMDSIKPYSALSDLSELQTNLYVEDKDLTILSSNIGSGEFILHDVTILNNGLVGNFYSETENIVLLTLPFDKGWSIFIDGKPIEYFAANGGFISFAVSPGESYIEMYFSPDGFKEGAIISLISIFSWILIIAYSLNKKRNNRKNHVVIDADTVKKNSNPE